MSSAPEQPTSIAPRVSVILPTHGRPHLLSAAVHSALAQTQTDIEVIVIVDGPDEPTEAALAAITDPRLRVEVLPANQGVSVARNRGAELARAPWVALLDDDDEWMPTKLQQQLQVAEASRFPSPIIATRFLARFVGHEHVWPRRVPRAGEPLCEYLLCPSSPTYGEGVLLPSTLLCRRELMLQVPSDVKLRRLQDVDWLVRVGARPEVGVEFVPDQQPLAVWDQREFSLNLSVRRSAATWREYLEWLDGLRPLLTRRAYSSALLTWLAPSAVRFKETDSFWPLLRAAFRDGSPRPLDVALYLAVWTIPPGLKGALSRGYERLRQAVSRGPPS